MKQIITVRVGPMVDDPEAEVRKAVEAEGFTMQHVVGLSKSRLISSNETLYKVEVAKRKDLPGWVRSTGIKP